MTNFSGKNLDNAESVGRKTEHQDDASQRDGLPEGWIFAPIGDLCDLINGRAFKQTEWREKGLPIIRIQNLNKAHAMFNYYDGELEEKHLVNYGDLLFAWSGTPGTSFGAHEWRGEQGALNQHIFKLVFDNKHIDKSFFLHSINFKLNELIGNANGGVGLRHVTKGVFEGTLLEYPPLAEQQQIAQKLDELLAQVDTLKTRLDAIPKILKRFRQSVLAAAVSGRLTEGVPFEVKTLGDIIEVGPQNGIYKPSSFYGEGNRIVRIDGFYDGEMCDWEKIKRVQLDKDELSKWQLNVSDILINRVNSIEYLGKCALVRTLPEPAVFESNIMRITLDLSQANPEYVAYFLSSVIGLERLRANAKLAVNQASINQTDVKNCQIELPPIDVQEEIVIKVKQFIAYADQIEQRVKDAQARVNHLTQSILAKAFRGELTADWRAQNPELISGENSAAALLERIKAGREVIAKPKRKSK